MPHAQGVQKGVLDLLELDVVRHNVGSGIEAGSSERTGMLLITKPSL